MLNVPIELGERSYEVRVGDGAFAQSLDEIRKACPRGRAILVTDTQVAEYHLGTVSAALSEVGLAVEPIIIEPGEGSKSWSQLTALTDEFLDRNLERSEAVLALGGGVVGDLAGFAAAITKRGTRFIQIPTTLLAQVDSSVGGKTGINTRHGKNFIGAFHQPDLVIADTGMLATLPERERRAGYAEIVKAALIQDAAMFDRLEAQGENVLHGDALDQAIADAVAFKARIVAADEREAGQRALLNLGHTFGHAFEAEAPKGLIRHGEAVAFGLVLAFDYAACLRLCPEEDAERVRAHLKAVGLPTNAQALGKHAWKARRLVARMRDDKKNSGGEITLILARGIGKAYIETSVDETDLFEFMETSL